MEKIRILIAEDQTILRNNLQNMLEQTNRIEVLAAVGSGKEAVIEAQQLRPEIILMDVEMESGNAGLIAAEKIFKLNLNIKIIFLTVHEDDSTIIEALNIGGTDYVIKTSDCKNAIEHIYRAHEDKVVLEGAISNVLHEEYMKMAKAKEENLDFLKKVILLTPSERTIIFYLLRNKKPSEIAELRFVEIVTIKKQIGAILKKLSSKRTKEVVCKINQLEIESLFQEGI